MAGNPDVSYDDDQQQAAAPKVTETWDAVTGSRKHTEALGSAMDPLIAPPTQSGTPSGVSPTTVPVTQNTQPDA